MKNCVLFSLAQNVFEAVESGFPVLATCHRIICRISEKRSGIHGLVCKYKCPILSTSICETRRILH